MITKLQGMPTLRILLLHLILLSSPVAVNYGQTSETKLEDMSMETELEGNVPPAELRRESTNISTIEPSAIWENDEIVKSVIVIGFALIVFTLLIFRIKVQEMHAEDFIRLIVLALVICSSMYLISAGWDDQQTAPAFGILGTIAGYLLGRGSNASSSSQN